MTDIILIEVMSRLLQQLAQQQLLHLKKEKDNSNEYMPAYNI
jgi:hypothetical protein